MRPFRLPLAGFLFSAATALLLPSCSPKSTTVQGTKCDAELGTYTLRHAAPELMPYENKSIAVFTDSTGRLDTFRISFHKKSSSRQLHNVYQQDNAAEKTCYCFTGQYFNCYLESKSAGVKFRIDVGAKPLCLAEQRPCTDPAPHKSVDILQIVFTDLTAEPLTGYLGFYKIMGQNTIPDMYGTLEQVPELNILGRKFSKIEQVRFKRPSASKFQQSGLLYYSTSAGIVAYSTPGKGTWRLEKLE